MDKTQKMLAGKISILLGLAGATIDDAFIALLGLIVYSAVLRKVDKPTMIARIAAKWDELEKGVRQQVDQPRGEDLNIELSERVRAEMAEDPRLNAKITDVMARIREAVDGVATGKYADLDEAMAAIGGRFVNKDDLPDDVRRQLEDDD